MLSARPRAHGRVSLRPAADLCIEIGDGIGVGRVLVDGGDEVGVEGGVALGDGEGVALLVPRVGVDVPGPEEAEVGVVDGDDGLDKGAVVHDRVDDVEPRAKDRVGVLRLDGRHTGAVQHRGRGLVGLEESLHLLLDVVVDFVPLE